MYQTIENAYNTVYESLSKVGSKLYEIGNTDIRGRDLMLAGTLTAILLTQTACSRQPVFKRAGELSRAQRTQTTDQKNKNLDKLADSLSSIGGLLGEGSTPTTPVNYIK